MNKLKYIISTVVLAAATITGFAQSAPTAPKNTGWVSSAALGFSLAAGNTENMLATGNLLSSKKWERNEIDLGLDGNYGKTGSIQSVGNIHGFGQYNRLFTGRTFGLLRVDALNDAIADIDYRLTVSPGVGYYFIKSTNTFLRGEVGPGFVTERQGGISRDYVSLRLAERYETKISDTAKLWQSLEFLPEFQDFKDYVINFEIGIETALTKQLSLRTYVQDTYDSVPAAGLKKNDVKLVTSLVYKF